MASTASVGLRQTKQPQQQGRSIPATFAGIELDRIDAECERRHVRTRTQCVRLLALERLDEIDGDQRAARRPAAAPAGPAAMG